MVSAQNAYWILPNGEFYSWYQINTKGIWQFQIFVGCYMWNYQLCVGHANQKEISNNYSRSINWLSYLHFGPPRLMIFDNNSAFIEVVHFIVRAITFQLKRIGPFHHRWFKNRKSNTNITKMITKHLARIDKM